MASPVAASDQQLAARTARGDQDAFALLYERYAPGVYDLAARLLRDNDLAGELVQTTFLKAWTSLRREPRVEHVKAWLFTIARNTALNELKRRRREEPLDDDDDEAGERRAELVATGPWGDPEQTLQHQEQVALLEAASRLLSGRDASLLDLHYRQELNADDLAASFGVSKGTLYTMLSRARQALAEAVATVVLVRRGRRDCPELAALVAGHAADEPDQALRLVVRRHLQACAACRERSRRYLVPGSAWALPPAVPLTPAAQADLWQRLRPRLAAGEAEPPAGASRDGVAAPAVAGRRPRQGPRRWDAYSAPVRLALVALAVAAIGLPLVALAVVAGRAPGGNAADPADVHSPSHPIGVPTGDAVIAVAWSPPAAARAYSIGWSEDPSAVPDTVPDLPGTAGGTASPPLGDGAWYFHLRTQGRSGRWTSTVHLGPFLVRSLPAATPAVPAPAAVNGGTRAGATPPTTPPASPIPPPSPTAALQPTATPTPSAPATPTAGPTPTPPPGPPPAAPTPVRRPPSTATPTAPAEPTAPTEPPATAAPATTATGTPIATPVPTAIPLPPATAVPTPTAPPTATATPTETRRRRR